MSQDALSVTTVHIIEQPVARLLAQMTIGSDLALFLKFSMTPNGVIAATHWIEP
jgi:hypothetical protein